MIEKFLFFLRKKAPEAYKIPTIRTLRERQVILQNTYENRSMWVISSFKGLL